MLVGALQGALVVVEMGNSVICPDVVIRPILSLLTSVNHRLPSGPGVTPLSLTHVRARQARTYPARATTRVLSPTMTTARPRQRLGVIVRAGVDEDVVLGPLWLPWGGVGPLAQLLQ